MSWSINVTSKSKDILFNAVDKDEHIPTPLKEAMKEQINALVVPDTHYANAFQLYTWGHLDSNGGGCEFKLTPTKITE